MSKNLRSLDLNLLPVLNALLAERSVTNAARRIGLSQPAASNALARLRAILGDALLVKSGRIMVRTTLGEHLHPIVEAACRELERVLHYEIWSPMTVKRKFVIAMTDYLIAAVTREFTELLAVHAPLISVQFTPISTRIRDQLIRGRIDLAYLGYSSPMAEGINVEQICSNILQGIAPPGHRFATTPPRDLAEFAAEPRIGVDIPSGYLDPDQLQMAELLGSAQMQIELSTAHLSCVPLLAASTGSVAVVPATIAAHAAKTYGMTIVDLPGVELEYRLCQYWSPKFDTDPGNRWLRDIMSELTRNAFTPPARDAAGSTG